MTSTEHLPVASDSLNASPRSEPASFEIIDSPAADVSQPIPNENTPDANTEVLARVQHALDDEEPLDENGGDAPVDPAILIQILLRKPLVVHALASRARAVLLKDFMQIKRAIPPIPEPPRTGVELSALTLHAAVHVLLSTSPYTSEFCSRLAHHPVLAALATHPASDPGTLAFMYILINSTEGAELARKVAEIHAARVRDWFALRAAEAAPVYESFTGAARVAWEQAAVWAPSIALSGSAIALFVALDS